jgi:hypothetical protein
LPHAKFADLARQSWHRHLRSFGSFNAKFHYDWIGYAGRVPIEPHRQPHAVFFNRLFDFGLVSKDWLGGIDSRDTARKDAQCQAGGEPAKNAQRIVRSSDHRARFAPRL